MNRVLSLGLSGLVLTVLSVGLFRLAFPAPPRSSPGMQAVDGSTPSPGKRVAPGQRLPPVDSLRLVHAPTDTGSAGASSTAHEREAPPPGTPATEFPVTDLPFRLIGTVIGPSGYRAAVIEHTDSGTTRSLLPGRSWESLLVRRVDEERIQIQNTRRNRLEVLYLARTDTGPGGNGGGGEQPRAARSEEDENRASRQRPARRSETEDQPTRRKKKRAKDREAMQKLQEILKERRNR